MRLGILVVLALGLAGCSGKESTASSTPPASTAPANNTAHEQSDNQTSTPEQSNHQAAAAEPVQVPVHHYVIEENGEYGYESGVSENERKNGQVAAGVSMVRYRGVIKGYHTLTTTKNRITTTLRCKDPCDFAKVSNSAGNITSDPETMRLAEGSIGWAMAQDAMNGQLQVYRKQ
ncbi:hypothetical protein [Aquitalea sp. FJL05]|uniref:hypothetical protein n=1 Tax=Aquitalea sp. FJL05 TaxID=2153366 RepID=UPI000F5A165B|nr:hypothetical protein [Aquitalea sp. FJL05]